MAGADQAANRLWDNLAGAKPFDLSVQLTRFDRAAHTGDLAAMEKIIPLIEKIDGVNGQSTRLARAIHDIQESQAKTDRAQRDRRSDRWKQSSANRVFLPRRAFWRPRASSTI